MSISERELLTGEPPFQGETAVDTMQAILRCGSDDDLVGTNRRLVQALHERKLAFSYREDVGAHSWQYWSNRMVEMLTAVDGFFVAGQQPAPSVQ